jgi:hypothetical protein
MIRRREREQARKKRVYYAHPMSLYGTPQESRDVELLQSLGFEVVNPNAPAFSRLTFNNYLTLAATCDLIAFRALPDGSITCGVAKEIKMGPPVIELPSGVSRRALTLQQTLETLAELGER